MNDLIKVSYENERPTVMGRDLHEALGIRTAYKDWFPRMCEYGFTEGTDFCSILSESTGGRPGMDHQMTIEMAKEICMIQRTDIGKKCREYFLELERRWNSPEAIMARALQFANQQLSLIREQNMEMGTGKSLVGLAVAGILFRFSLIERVLVVCPLSIMGVWEEELVKFADYPYSVTLLKGTMAKKKEQLMNLPRSEFQMHKEAIFL